MVTLPLVIETTDLEIEIEIQNIIVGRVNVEFQK